MGLDTSHDCFHGAYGAFARWRNEIARQIGLPIGTDGHYELDWDVFTPANAMGDWETPPDDPIMVLMVHSDCEGTIPSSQCARLADRLEGLLLKLDERPQGHLLHGIKGATERFIAGLRRAAAAGEDVDFH